MDRLDAMRIFVAVVDAGSLAAAARALGRSPSLVTRAIAQLERAAGGRLLERTTRRFAVTDLGARHALAYRSLLDDLSRLDELPHDREIVGTVAVTAPELFGRLKVLPVVESFLRAHPRVRVRFLLVNRIVDLVGEGVDVAVRVGPLPDTSLTAVKLGEIRRLTCAAPAYLARHAPLSAPGDLSAHACLGLNEAGLEELWPYREKSGSRRIRSVRVNCLLTLNSAGAAIDSAKRGLGLVRPLSYQVEGQLAQGSLVTVLADHEPDPIPVHLLFRGRRHQSPAVGAFVDHALPRLRQGLRTAS